MSEQKIPAEQMPEKKNTKVRTLEGKKRIRIIAAAAVGTLLVIYVGVSLYFMNRFLPGTKLNDRKVGGYTAEKVKSEVADEIHSYEIKIQERENKEESIKGSDIDLEPQWGSEIEEMIAAQSGFAWPVKLFAPDTLENETLVSYDADKLAQQIDALEGMQPDNQIAPQNATIAPYDKENGFALQPCVMGTTIDRDKFGTAVDEAVAQLAESVSVEDVGAYIDPTVFDDDENLASAIDTMNQYAKTTITYQIGESTEVLDATTFGEWITLNKKEKPVIRKKKVAEYVAGLAKKYNTCYTAKKLKTSYGKTVTIGLSCYGWKVDNDTETKQIIKEIKAGKPVTRDLNYLMTANSHEGNDYGDSYVEINLTAQHLFLYKEGKLVIESDFVSGNLARGYDTPTGAYGITYTQKDAVLRGDNYETPVSYWMPFAGNVGMHDASWRSSFGGSIYKTAGSHGCVNLPPSAAKVIFENVSKSYPVLVYELPGTESTAVVDQASAAAVVKLIDAIGEVTGKSKDAIEKAQSAYDKLNANAKTYVTNYATLEKAQKDFAKLSKSKDDKKDDKKNNKSDKKKNDKKDKD